MVGVTSRASALRSALLVMLILFGTSRPGNADDAIKLGVSVIGDFASNLSGGRRSGADAFDRSDIALDVNGDALGAAGIGAHVDVMATNGGGFSQRYVGDLQGVSNIDAPDGITLFEAWGEKSWGETAALKIGIIDLNSEFDVQDLGVAFINSSFGIAPDYSHASVLGPSIFPYPGLGARTWFRLGDHLQLKLGAFNMESRSSDHPHAISFASSSGEGALLAAEISASGPANTTLKLGYWRYTGSFSPIGPASGSAATGNQGAYSSALVHLYRIEGDGDRGLDGWLRLGSARAEFDTVSAYVGGGVVFTGPLASRPADQTGVAFATAFMGSQRRQAASLSMAPLSPQETEVEVTYLAPLLSWLTVQPDLQYVIDPGAVRGVHNALVFDLRLSVHLSAP